MEKQFCQSCGMPLDDENLIGTDANGAKSGEYCVYCYNEGAFLQDVTMEEMIGISLKQMNEMFKDSPDYNEKEALENMNAFFPGLKRWAN